MIVIVDYGMGNVGSIASMLRKCRADVHISCSLSDIEAADKLILPGVGAFDAGIRALRDRGVEPLLRQRALDEKIPVLGICLGMQLLTHGSEEGQERGLGWIDAQCVRFRGGDMPSALKVPHMGWNDVHGGEFPVAFASELPRFYFVHSFHVECADSRDVLGMTTYGYDFVSAVRRDNVMGVQFHPEKSHRYGLRLLQWFAEG